MRERMLVYERTRHRPSLLSDRISLASVACLGAAGVVIAVTCSAPPATVRANNDGGHDACGCPSPDEVCQSVCTACICRHLEHLYVNDAARYCAEECK
jgi:hypothetical protein